MGSFFLCAPFCTTSNKNSSVWAQYGNYTLSTLSLVLSLSQTQRATDLWEPITAYHFVWVCVNAVLVVSSSATSSPNSPASSHYLTQHFLQGHTDERCHISVQPSPPSCSVKVSITQTPLLCSVTQRSRSEVKDLGQALVTLMTLFLHHLGLKACLDPNKSLHNKVRLTNVSQICQSRKWTDTLMTDLIIKLESYITNHSINCLQQMELLLKFESLSPKFVQHLWNEKRCVSSNSICFWTSFAAGQGIQKTLVFISFFNQRSFCVLKPPFVFCFKLPLSFYELSTISN